MYLAEEDSSQIGAFRTPGLRNVALRAPYMHAGQFNTLEEVIRHYRQSPPAVAGRSEISARNHRGGGRIAIHLELTDVQDLVAFLGTLNGTVNQTH
jgi:cytochrome c peroxidase